MQNPTRGLRIVLALSVAVVVAACAEQTATEPLSQPRFSTTTGAVLIECPTNQTASATALLGPLGGELTVDGHSLTLPVGAVLAPTEFVLTVPASRYVEIRIQADGQEGFAFLEPVRLTMSYERCTRSNIDGRALQVFKIDPETKALIKPMGGSDDKLARRITVQSDSLSGWAIAR